ncbi:permease-like cell division protein FtsX [Actinoplanes sp. L3-i22]|uniref:permease-like cell division protein FtsX n=1 Tax=Actinoplanes sp. L3-i22 TaxID=2836373 RepID=UPI001C793C94|nr:permease-like cell division protein FtsX [Actinoplanes sp. L3-i22]BCY15434.1 hypothetical protein L3i22_105220 [Actinoplanes sp. L3-i22]
MTLSVLAGCSGAPEADRRPTVYVYIERDLTDQQKAVIEGRLSAVPGTGDLHYISPDESLARLQSRYPSPGPDFSPNLGSVPIAYRLTVTDVDAYRTAINGPLASELQALPGVLDTTFPCLTPLATRRNPQPLPTGCG